MGNPQTVSSVTLGNHIQAVIAAAISMAQDEMQIRNALLVKVDHDTDEIQAIQVISDDEMTDIVLMYQDKVL